MQSFSVAEVAAMLGVSEESVRRWIRDGKLVADRRIGRTGSSVALTDIVHFVNQPPCNYVNAMSAWLKAHNIEHTLSEVYSDLGTKLATTTVGLISGGLVGGIIAGHVASGMKRPQILLRHSTDAKIVDAISDRKTDSKMVALPAPAEKLPTNNVEVNQVVPDENKLIVPVENYEAKIVEEQKKLIKLKQELARINAQISITEGQIEYYKLMLQQK